MCPSACPSSPVQKKRFEKEKKKTHALPHGGETAQKRSGCAKAGFCLSACMECGRNMQKNGFFLPLQRAQTHADAHRRALKRERFNLFF